MNSPKKIYIIAGEASGDMHGSHLVSALKSAATDFHFYGFGGNRMQDIGVTLHRHVRDLSIVGFWEVVQNLGAIRQSFKIAKREILKLNPDMIILIDYPGFNLRMAKWAKNRGFKVVYYIAPQAWAWKKNRVKSLKKYVDELLVILPFEKEFFEKEGVTTAFVGHPLVDEIEAFHPDNSLVSELESWNDRTKVAVFPGSRKTEISRLLPILKGVALAHREKVFLLAAPDHIDGEAYAELKNINNIKIISGKSYDIMSLSDVGLIKSGTSTLEAALLGLPQVTFYKLNHFSYKIASLLVSGIKYISLPNLILDKPLITELIQKDCRTQSISDELDHLLNAERKTQILDGYQELQEILKTHGSPSVCSAQRIMKLLKA